MARRTGWIWDFISRQSTTATPVRVGVVTYDPQNLSSLDVPGTGTGFTGRHDGGAFASGTGPNAEGGSQDSQDRGAKETTCSKARSGGEGPRGEEALARQSIEVWVGWRSAAPLTP